jgi:D-3-phosphoglycerate dehydrogenase
MQCLRIDFSSYFAPDYAQKERALLCNIAGIDYINAISQIKPEQEIIWLTSSNSRLEGEILNFLPQIKLIIHANSGHDNLDLDLISSRQIPIIFGNSIRAQAVAEYHLSCFFKHFTNLPLVTKWDPHRNYKRDLLETKNALILGLGHIGKILQAVLTSLGLNIHVIDPLYSKLTFNDLNLNSIDALFICCDLNPTSEGLVHFENLKKIKPDGLIVNAARGKIIYQKDLIKWLKLNPMASAYLDVFEQEPSDFKCFELVNNCYFSSHVAGVHNNLERDMIDFIYQAINNFLRLNKSR